MVRPPSFDRNGMKKGAWSKEEDDKLRAYVLRYGHWNWRLLPKYAGLARCGKSCRLRWVNYLKPGLKRGNFNRQEEDLIIQLHAQLGNKWSAIAAKLPGRTDNEIKNFWHTRVEKHRSRKSSPVVKTQDTDTGGASQISEDKHSEDNNYSIKRWQQNSTLVSFDTAKPSPLLSVDGARPISTLPSFDAKLSDELSVSDESEETIWPDMFLPDTTNYAPNDYCFPQLEDPEYNIYIIWPEFHQYMNCSELSSSDSTTNHNLSALDDHYWIGDVSSDHLWDGDSFPSSNNASNSPVVLQKKDEVVGGFYDSLLQYCCFDDGINMFG